MKIIISRTDKIGDVVLSLPVAGVIKQYFPSSVVYFLGRSYTEAVIKSSRFVDHFVNWDELKNKVEPLEGYKDIDVIIHVYPDRIIAKAAKNARIGIRIGTNHRLYHFFTCNKRVSLSRKKSDLHEAQLNIRLLEPLGVKVQFSMEEISNFYGWKSNPTPSQAFLPFLPKERFNLILHMKSLGSAREWPVHYFYKVAKRLSENFNIIITGTKEEGEVIQRECPSIFKLKHVKNACGKFNLSEFVRFIECADGLVACSTGPLHIAAASGIYVLGLYPSARPMHMGRWGAIGKKAFCIEENKLHSELSKNTNYLDGISPEQVYEIVSTWEKPVLM